MDTNDFDTADDTARRTHVKYVSFEAGVDMPEEHKDLLKLQIEEIGNKYANGNKEINFEQYMKLLDELVLRKDLTEAEKLYMVGKLVCDYRGSKAGKEGAFKLTNYGATKYMG